jgi:hypothetical protein
LSATTLPNVFFLIYKVICSSHYFDSLLFHEPHIFYKTSFQLFLSFWEHVKTWIRQWVIPLHVPYTPPPIFHTQKLLLIFFPFFHFYDSLLFHKPGIFYKTSFQFFLSFWEHVKTWVRLWVIPLHVPYTPPPIFHTQKLLLIFFPLSSLFYNSLLFHKPGIFYKTSFRIFLSFWEHFKSWGGKLDVLQVLPAKAKKHGVGNRCRSDVAMVRCLRSHMAHLNVGPCRKESR